MTIANESTWPRIAFDFRDVRVLVTGGTSGIGEAIARAYVRAGAHVTITGTRADANAYAKDFSMFEYRQLRVEDAAGIDALAAGVGWMREEYELMGQDFATRGKRLDEMIPALRELWKGGWVSWSGTHYEVPEMTIEPHPPAPVPILCGGESDAALRRAATLCDGWVGYAYGWDDAVGYATRLTALRRELGRENEPFDILLALLEPPSVDLYKRAEDAGITQVMVRPYQR